MAAEQLKLFEDGHFTPRIIGLSGPAGSGKDAAFSFIQEALKDKDVQRDAFADRLKISAARALGCTGDEEECKRDMNWIKKDGYIAIFDEGGNLVGGISGREYLQYYGTEAHRDVFGFDFWVEAVLPEVNPPYHGRAPFDVLVITDVRFENEARAIKECGGEVWRIERETQIQESAHASEAGLPEELIDRTIINDGTLEEFRTKVEAFLDANLQEVS
jgi:hypothetical protein